MFKQSDYVTLTAKGKCHMTVFGFIAFDAETEVWWDGG
jgi:hypothetical protein